MEKKKNHQLLIFYEHFSCFSNVSPFVCYILLDILHAYLTESKLLI